MALKTRLGKAEFEALDESLKSHYVQDGDNFKLDADYEDVTGLKAKNAELLAELKKKGDLTKQFEGLNPEEARAALEQLSKIEEDKLLSKQKFDEVLAKKEQAWKAQLEKESTEKQTILAGFKQKELALTLLNKGVRKEYLDLASLKLDGEIEVAAENGSLALKVRNGIGDSAFDELVGGLKTNYPALFEPNGASGSGASGSQGSGGQSATTWTRAQWDDASAADRTAFSNAKGKIEG